MFENISEELKQAIVGISQSQIFPDQALASYRVISDECKVRNSFADENIEYVCQHGYLRHITEEFHENPLRLLVCRAALSSLTHVSLNEKNALTVARSGIIDILLSVTIAFHEDPLGDVALTCLSSLALHKEARPFLLTANVISVALKYLRYLNAEDDRGIDFGLTAASLICRLSDMGKTK